MSHMTQMSPEIAKRLVVAQRAVQNVAKDSTNSFHKYKYASSEDVVEEARRALNAAGLAVCRIGWELVQPDAQEKEDFIRVVYMVVAETGENHVFLPTATPAVPEKGRPADKAVAGALTLNQNYFLLGLLEIVRADENDVEKRNDADHTPKRLQARAPQQAPRAATVSETIVLRNKFEDIADHAELKLFVEKRKSALVTAESQGKDMEALIVKTADRVGVDPKDALAWYAAA